MCRSQIVAGSTIGLLRIGGRWAFGLPDEERRACPRKRVGDSDPDSAGKIFTADKGRKRGDIGACLGR